jgi:metallo-beta-lactamase class B
VGLQEIGAYALNTSQGIILIDALFPGEEERRLLANMKKVGLDPKRIKYVIATHAHPDHMGGAKYLQEKYGAKVVMSAQDWDFAMRGDGAATAPKRDVVVADGDKVTLGDTSVTIYFTPGHTPGSTSVMFPVKEGGQTHLAAMWGGPQWGFANADVPQRELYEKSLVRFHDAMKTQKPDVILENHPFLSNMIVTFAGMRGRKAGTPNPLVVGADAADRYMQIWLECGRANMERYKEYVARYGPNARQWPAAFAP